MRVARRPAQSNILGFFCRSWAAPHATSRFCNTSCDAQETAGAALRHNGQSITLAAATELPAMRHQQRQETRLTCVNRRTQRGD